jgi:polyhydroxybutyrate depolymerase
MSSDRRIVRILVTAVLALALPAMSPASAASRHDQTQAIQIGSQSRSYLLHLPPGPLANLPLLLVFHGGGSQGAGMLKLTGFDQLADREGFAVVYPNGLDQHWNDGRSSDPTQTDDVSFINALLDKLEHEYPIDARRVFAAGISNGGFFSQYLALRLTSRFAAVASVAATLGQGIAQAAGSGDPVSVLMIHGTGDPIVAYDGGPVKGRKDYGGISAPVAETATYWATRNGCNAVPTVSALPDVDSTDRSTVTRSDYGRCKAGTGVVLYAVQGGGHTWPGGPQYAPAFLIGRTNRDFSASNVIWDFFKAHPKHIERPAANSP